MSKSITIANRPIGEKYPAYIIAEAGVNHNGSFALARKMVKAAKAAGSDAIKFQVFNAANLVTMRAPKARYQKNGAPSGESQLDMLSKLELSQTEFIKLDRYCKELGLHFLATPFEPQSAEFLAQMGVPAFKIGSGELTNLPLLRQIASYLRPIILSTGMSTLAEIKTALKCIYAMGNQKIVLLHCTSAYPAPFEEVNLKAISALKDLEVLVGYSDHTLGIEVSIAAVSLGACVIEKHFTLDRDLPGPDHKASLMPEQLAALVQAIRNVEKAQGSGGKVLQPSEIEIRKVARKSIVAAQNISSGTRLTSNLLTIKRPGTGIEPGHFDALLGKTIRSDLKKDQLLSWDML